VTQNAHSDAHAAWRALLEISARSRAGAVPTLPWSVALPTGRLTIEHSGHWRHDPPPPQAVDGLLALYLPYCLAKSPRGFVVAHLGQSLDGRIATEQGASRWITGEEDVAHNHRMRALADAVLVGAATLRCDDPQLTVRSCDGRHPIRIVLDTERTLDDGYRVFRDGSAPTLVLAAADKVAAGDRLGDAEIVGVKRTGRALAPAAIRQALAARGLVRLFVEGGGVTVSRFLEAGCLDRLQIIVSPVIIGSGRPGITLPPIEDLRHGLRPKIRRFPLGEDVMYECILGDGLP
jgi:diaminohydroxyphosphoribosylaminopyrimidine deaminase/5-amino-6-(5-phosphoribosylamino)uracil reductase